MSNNCGKTYQVEYGTENPCELTSTSCAVQTDPIPYLGLPENSTQEEINTALVLALQAANNRITQLENS